jgi:ketosteroid isomerase-like protein
MTHRTKTMKALLCSAILVSIVLSVPFASAQVARTPTPALEEYEPDGNDAARMAITHALGDWMDATNRGDAKKAADVWAPGVQGWFPKLAVVQIAEAYRVAGVAPSKADDKAAKPWSTWKLSIDEILVSGDLAVVRDLWGETVHFPGTPKVAVRDIRSFEVWRRQPDGKWRITRWISAPEAWASGS